jgi:hypothetical protein
MNDTAGISALTDEETVDFMRGWIQVKAEAEAQIIRGLEHFYRLREHIENGKYAHDEIAAELSWTTRAAANQMHTAVALVKRLPDIVDALESGQLDLPKARAILDWTNPLPVEQARDVAATAADFAIGRTVTAMRQKLAREVIKVDPQGAETRRKQRANDREVRLSAEQDGMATLSIYDTADRLRAVYELLDHLASQTKAAGSDATFDQLRCDAFTSLLLGECSERVRVELRVTVPASVLAGTSHTPGWLHGYGPITSQQVRDLASRSQFWRRVVTDPLTGMVQEVSRRHPSAALRDYVNTRTPTCVAIGCGRPAESCDTDHTHDHAKGGATSPENLGPACRHHNLMKLNGGWTLDQPKPGYFVWTTPTGRRFDVEPQPVVEPTPDPVPIDEPAPF